MDCEGLLDQVISADGSTGAIPELVSQAIADGARVAWVGYMAPQADAAAFSTCGAALEAYAVRLSALDAAQTDRVFFDGRTLGKGEADSVLYTEDGYHPSEEGSAQLGAAVAMAMQAAFGL